MAGAADAPHWITEWKRPSSNWRDSHETAAKDFIIDEIRSVASLADASYISRVEFDKHSKVSSSAVVKRFGAWASIMDDHK